MSGWRMEFGSDKSLLPMNQVKELRRYELSPLRTDWCRYLGLLLLGLGLAACAAGCDTQNPAAADDPPALADNGQHASEQRLDGLIARREHDQFSMKFAIGPGDVLEISVPDVQEFKNRVRERVSPQGDIELPIAGLIHVAGRTEPEVRQAIVKGLSKYIKDPQVDVFVSTYASRQVAVMGMVNKPGLYTLTRRDETILDLIGEAGGLSDGAGSSLVFLPGAGKVSERALENFQSAVGQPGAANSAGALGAAKAETRERAGAEQPAQVAAANFRSPGTGLLPAGNPIFISVAGGRQNELQVPVRPGDVIMVPARGQVLVQGWVLNPGAYQITPGMTALGAVTAAGGQMYSSDAVVLRASPDGQKIKLPVDLARVESGKSPDIAVQSGDVVIVERSLVGAVPYSLYFLLTRFGAGMAIPLPVL
jgi:protein involved in polysaccharide export with SLBB domain